MTPINLAEKLVTFSTHGSPKIVGQVNGHDLMVVKLLGEFVWHDHPDTDDVFPVLKGEVTSDLEGGAVTLKPGEVLVVPKGDQHRSRAAVETHLFLIEPAGTPNGGDPATAATRVHL
jgi:mannose-6-phosphate isomerase-like protein (cupin superfamily)